jgi:hypothetical protein
MFASTRSAFLSHAITQLTPVANARSWDYFASFNRGLFTSWWLSLGWGRFLPPGWWISIAATLSVVAALGVLMVLTTRTRATELAWLALFMLVVPIAAEYFVYYRVAIGGQGRHLFPVIIPTAFLLCVGIEQCVPTGWRRFARGAAVLVIAGLDTAAWIVVAIPVYGHG